jgi:sugar phosphate isomerase/epimerase
MLKIGATTLPLAGWVVDPRRPEEGRAQRLAAICQLVEGYGLPAVELSLDLGAAYPQVFDGGFYHAVAELQQELGFVCTVHLPFLWVDLSSLNEPVRCASVDCLRRCVELVEPVEVHAYVVHLWGFTTTQIAAQLQDAAQRQAILAWLVRQGGRSLGALLEMLDPADVCVENLEDSVLEFALPLVGEMGTSICLDVGHLVWQGGDPLGFMAEHGDRVRDVHLHDAVRAGTGRDSGGQDHLALGRGHVDYDAFLSRLEEIGYEGAVILELNTREALEESLVQVGPFL